MTEYIFLDNVRVIIVLALSITDAANYLKLQNITAIYKGRKKAYVDITICSTPAIVFDSKGR